MFRFFSVAPWTLLPPDPSTPTPADEGELRPVVTSPGALSGALERVEYRGQKLVEHATTLLGGGARVVFARSPRDLPALLRTSDELLKLARQEMGERALLWRCSCGTSYSVPDSMVRPAQLRCEKCGKEIDLDNTSGQAKLDAREAHQVEVNACRESLAEFFREAMARGWPVLIEAAPAAAKA